MQNVSTHGEGLVSGNAKGNKDIQKGMQETAGTKKQSEISRTQRQMTRQLSFLEDKPNVNVWVRCQLDRCDIPD